MADKKLTRRDMFEGIRATLIENFDEADIQDYVAFIDKEIDAILARAKKEAEKRAEKAAAGDDLRNAVKEVIEAVGAPITPEDIAEKLAEDFPEVTKSKVVNRASALVKAGEIDKTEVKVDKNKRVAYAPAGYVAAAEGDAE